MPHSAAERKKTMEDYSQFVPNVHFELIPIRNLVSNQEYQRSLKADRGQSECATVSDDPGRSEQHGKDE